MAISSTASAIAAISANAMSCPDEAIQVLVVAERLNPIIAVSGEVSLC